MKGAEEFASEDGGGWEGGEWAPSWEDMAAIFAAMSGGWGDDSWGDDGGWGKGDKGKGKGKGGKGEGPSKVAMKLAAGETVYHGTVKQYNPEKKHGYIVCDAIQEECGQDTYVFHEVLERAQAGPGDYVVFFIHWSPKGQPQASNPMVRISAADGLYALKGTYKLGKDPAAGFGFLDNPATKEFFGRDIYVHKDLAATMVPGQTYSFNAYLNRDAMPNALDAEVCDPEWEPVASDLTEPRRVEVDSAKGGKGGKGKGGKGKGGKGGWDDFSWGGGGDWWGGGGGGWDDWGGMALAVKGGGKSSFKGKSAKGAGKAVGGKGSFGKGKEKGSGTGAGPPMPTGKQCTGVLRSFNVDNNYGFIDCEEVKAEYGCDCFVHGRAFKDFGAEVGTVVNFEVGVSAKGQPQALNVTAGDSSAAAWSWGAEGGGQDPFSEAIAELEGPPAKRARTAGADEGDWGISDLDQMLMSG